MLERRAPCGEIDKPSCQWGKHHCAGQRAMQHFSSDAITPGDHIEVAHRSIEQRAEGFPLARKRDEMQVAVEQGGLRCVELQAHAVAFEQRDMPVAMWKSGKCAIA